jgi:hypothetical protein
LLSQLSPSFSIFLFTGIALRYIAAEFPNIPLNEDVIDLYAVATLFFSTGGTFWTDNTRWKSSNPVCEWSGIDCDETFHITAIRLHNNNLVGSIPPELALLSPRSTVNGFTQGLTRLDLSRNNIGGGIPPQVGRLEGMVEFILNDNKLKGRIPGGLANWNNVTEIALHDNLLDGSVPKPLCTNRSDSLLISVDCKEVECDCCQPVCDSDEMVNVAAGPDGDEG